MEITPVALILADISGYTRFITMHRISLLHAEQIITELMEAIIHRIKKPLMLNKLEGDAAFLYARAGDSAALPKIILEGVLALFPAFKARQQELIEAGQGGCFCEACCNIDQLQLKAVAHYGQAVLKKVHRLEELAGSDVILAHRLLKNNLPSHEYLLLTENFYQWSGGLEGLEPELYEETFADLGQVHGRVYFPPTPDLIVPETKRFTRLGGIMEGLKLFPKTFWRRLVQPKDFRNLSQ
jgi:hypothetical protein